MAKIGDIVRYLNATGGGRIVKIEGNIAYVDEDGFETPVLLRECVVVATAGNEPSKTTFVKVKETPAPIHAPAEQKVAPVAPPAAPEQFDIEETEGGNVMNLMLAFEPVDILRFSETEFDLVLVNDSNYFIGFAVMSRGNDEEKWNLLSAGTIEPNIQQLVVTLGRNELNGLDNVCVQYVAYKSHAGFELKAPASVEIKVDTTKFCKLHCFRQNVYFDTKVLAFPVVENDVPCVRRRQPDPDELRRGMMQKKRNDMRPVKRPVVKRNDRRNDTGTIEVDLHATELLDSTAGLSSADILNLQVDEFRRVMDANLRNKGQSIVFIHGKGEGVLRQALLKELNHRYKGHDVQDASFREYGFGATKVTIR